MHRRDALLIMGGACIGVSTISTCMKVKNDPKVQDKSCPCIDPEPPASTPLDRRHLHVCAFHTVAPGQNVPDPSLQLETHHYCVTHSEGVFSCLIYDSDQPQAKLLGVEYIVVNDIYQTFPEDEKQYWHPHTYEVLNGLLTTPNLPDSCENKLMAVLVNTWGKTWHTWPDPKTKVPMGRPLLMWSANRHGEIKPELIKAAERRYHYSTEEKIQQRKDLKLR